MSYDLSSPCIGFCSTTYGDDYCKGCYRHYQQVIDWEQLAYNDKKDFYLKVSKIVESVLKDAVEVIDRDKFLECCRCYQVEVQSDLPEQYHVMQLIQKASLQMDSIETGLHKKIKGSWSYLYSFLDKKIYEKISS